MSDAGERLPGGQAQDRYRWPNGSTARAAALRRWALEQDPSAATQAARDAAAARFLKLVDPAGELSPEERAKRAERARRAHMLRLAQLSADARRRRKGKP